MNTYQRQLLDKLINDFVSIDPLNIDQVHKCQMLAAELKGAMQAQDADDQNALAEKIASKFNEQNPTPDADGWVENTGKKPKCVVLEVRMLDRATGEVIERPYHNQLWNIEQTLAITHYRPA